MGIDQSREQEVFQKIEQKGKNEDCNKTISNMIRRVQQQEIEFKKSKGIILGQKNMNIEENKGINERLESMESVYSENANLSKKSNKILPSKQPQIQTQEIIIKEFSYLLFSLPNNIIRNIIKFLIKDYASLILVSPHWYYKIHDILEEELIELDNKFIKKYQQFLSFKQSYLHCSSLQVQKRKGFRMDRVIVAEILPSIKDKSIVIQYTYKNYNPKQQSDRFFCEYKFDSLQQNIQKKFWIYKEDCKHNFDKNKIAFIQPIIPIQIGDCLKISVNFYNLQGLINLDSIVWRSMKFSEIPSIDIHINPNDLGNYDKNRICEVEELYTDWRLYEYFQKNDKVCIDEFKPFLELQETRCAGVDLITSKLVYKALQQGEVPQSKKLLGIQINVLPKNQQICCEVKKTGLYVDLDNHLDLRVGDILIVYISKGD